MALHIDHTRIVSDQTKHQARSVGDGAWVVSFLPGRTLTIEQATAAMQAAEITNWVSALTAQIGLTVAEAAALATQASTWPEQPPTATVRRVSAGGRRAVVTRLIQFRAAL
ncbi:hypothetical protein [Nocardia brasiliensis]|uniref:hypothetical protein n=1 Tax=Nocardia brasiliensis TaxID=37326 RepID=UPI002457302A|nr:hypothetical protein [Nocardia brasiliensis]